MFGAGRGNGHAGYLERVGRPVAWGMLEDIPAADSNFLTNGEGAVVGDVDGERVFIDNLGAMRPDDHRATGAEAPTDNLQAATTEGVHSARSSLGHEH